MSDSNQFDAFDPAFQLDSGKSGAILSESWWLREVCLQLRRNKMRESPDSKAHEAVGELEVRMSTTTKCPDCGLMVYDEEIMAGWKVR